MKYFASALIYMSFIALIGFAIYFTKSALPLWALLVFPRINITEDTIDSVI